MGHFVVFVKLELSPFKFSTPLTELAPHYCAFSALKRSNLFNLIFYAPSIALHYCMYSR